MPGEVSNTETMTESELMAEWNRVSREVIENANKAKVNTHVFHDAGLVEFKYIYIFEDRSVKLLKSSMPPQRSVQFQLKGKDVDTLYFQEIIVDEETGTLTAVYTPSIV